MKDQLLMENYLLILKGTTEVYVHGTLESSNKDIRDILFLGLNETLNHQANCYDKITEYGWYQVNNVNKKEIIETLDKLKLN